VAYGQGFSGGYADAAVGVLEPPASSPAPGSRTVRRFPVWEPDRRPEPKPKPLVPVQRSGRSTLRLVVTASTSGMQMGRASMAISAEATISHGHGTARTTTNLRCRAADPKVDDRIALLMALVLLRAQREDARVEAERRADWLKANTAPPAEPEPIEPVHGRHHRQSTAGRNRRRR